MPLTPAEHDRLQKFMANHPGYKSKGLAREFNISTSSAAAHLANYTRRHPPQRTTQRAQSHRPRRKATRNHNAIPAHLADQVLANYHRVRRIRKTVDHILSKQLRPVELFINKLRKQIR